MATRLMHMGEAYDRQEQKNGMTKGLPLSIDNPEVLSLMESAKTGSIEVAAKAIKDGCNVNCVVNDASGQTALHVALQAEQADMCLWLISKGADPWIRDRGGSDCSGWAEEVMVGEDLLGRQNRYQDKAPPPDVVALAEHLGIPSEHQSKLLWIAEAALKAPLPFGWVEHTNQNGEVFYYNTKSKESTWEHPMDCFFKMLTSKYLRNIVGDRSSASRRSDMSTPSSNYVSASRLSTASTAIHGQHHIKDLKESRIGSIVNQQRSEQLQEESRGSLLAPDPTKESGHRSNDLIEDGPQEHVARAQTSAWGSSHMRASTASHPIQGTRAASSSRPGSGLRRGRVATATVTSSRDLLGPADPRPIVLDETEEELKMSGEHWTVTGVRRGMWSEEDLKHHVDKMQKCVAALRESSMEVNDAVSSDAFGLVYPGSMMNAIYNMVKGVEKMDRTAREAEIVAKREHSKGVALRGRFEILKGNITVMCRVRRVKSKESSCSFPLEDTVSVADQDAKGAITRKSFSFDRVFEPDSSQSQVFQDVLPVIAGLMKGSNVCVFAYGQTGSGKTYTMEGPVHDPGIHYRSMREMFKAAHEKSALGDDCTFKLTVLEIYNERVFDLLVDPRTAAERRKNKDDLPIKFDPQTGVRVEGITHITVDSVENVLDIIELAGRNRCIGVTSANEHSSRSHLIVTLNMNCRNASTGSEWDSKLHLVDLAGSERQSKTNAHGGRMVESNHINRSLSALHDVIAALSRKDQHIPYRNSKLTQMLQDSLSGNSQVLMLVTVSPRMQDVKESVSSLMLAKRVRSIELGGAKKEIANTEYEKIHKENSVQVAQLESQSATLESQVKIALGAANKTQIEVTRRNAIDSKKHEQDRLRWHQDRDELLRATEIANKQAKAFKEKLDALVEQQQIKGKPSVSEPIRDDVSAAIDNTSVMGDAGGRLESWRMRVAELTREVQDKENSEKNLLLDIKIKTFEALQLQEKLKCLESKLVCKVVTDIISSKNDGKSLYERLNEPPKEPPRLILPPKPVARLPQAPLTDRPEIHQRRLLRPANGTLNQLP